MAKEASRQPEAVMVGIGQIAFGSRGQLLCLAVGSCVALALLNESTGQGALAHIFLPRAKEPSAVSEAQAGKYANTAVPYMVRQLRATSKPEAKLLAWMVGGAKMFAKGFQQNGADVGRMNIDAVEAELAAWQIPILYSEVGGIHARNVRLDLAERQLTVYSGSGAEAHHAAGGAQMTEKTP